MITTVAARLWFAVAALATVALAAYLLFSDAEWTGSMVLGTIVVVAIGLGALAVAVRDGDVPDAEAATEPPVRRTGAAPWPVVAAVGAGASAVGLAGRNALLYAGIGILVIALAEWLIQGWSERATADPAYNLELRNRLMQPFEIPILSILVVGVVMISISRVLLAVSKTGSTVIAMLVATVILVVASLLVSKPRISSSVFASVLAIGAVLLLAGGIVGGVVGERDIEVHHGHGEDAEHAEEGEHGTEDPVEQGVDGTEGEEGNNPNEDEGGEDQSEPGADPHGAPTDGETTPGAPGAPGDDAGEPTLPGEDDSESTPASTP